MENSKFFPEIHGNFGFGCMRLPMKGGSVDSVESRKVYEVCEKHGKPVVVMEPVKGGSLINLPEEAWQNRNTPAEPCLTFFISSGNCKASGAHAQPDSSAGNHRGLGETPTKRFQKLAGRAENGNQAFVYTNALLR